MIDTKNLGKVSEQFLGRLGENKARVIPFDVSDIRSEFPGASFIVLNKRPNDTDSYPVSNQNVRLDGNVLLWTVVSGDVAQEGYGRCEVRASVDDVVVKTKIWATRIDHALDGAGTPPEPWQGWIDQVKEDADRAEAAAELLEHPGAVAETLEPGASATASYSEGTFTFGIPDAYSPSATVTKNGTVATITITDKNGTTTANVNDGSALIDDTAGQGDTDKSWSADKLTGELAT